MEGYDYDAAARTVEIDDITSDATNREILRRLKENDPTFYQLWLVSRQGRASMYCPDGAHDFGWLGYYIGENTVLKKLDFYTNPFHAFDNNAIEPFYRGVNGNRSIQKIAFHSIDPSGGEIFQSLRPFFDNNSNLSEIVAHQCEFGAGSAREISLALRSCNKSLKSVNVQNNQMGDEPLVEIIEAMTTHPRLEKLALPRMNIGRNECRAVATLLRHADIELQELNLSGNDIGDEGTLLLANALSSNSKLRTLDLDSNGVTARGCQGLAALLENPNCNLEELNLYINNVGDEGALIFASALVSNRKLKTLGLGTNNGITVVGWSSILKVLCDTSSINNTFLLSNHTLQSLCFLSASLPSDVQAPLILNSSSANKKQVAMKKIVRHHQHFDMQPFFEWELKVLPIAIEWFERARSIHDADETCSIGRFRLSLSIVIGKNKLGAIYQFIRAMPEVFEPAPDAAGGERKRGGS